jgi:hypothetical protein
MAGARVFLELNGIVYCVATPVTPRSGAQPVGRRPPSAETIAKLDRVLNQGDPFWDNC